ncbi:hypothetical protein M0R89_15345 [Halorussus limi]|uniref:D-isomer specific 2-hydroxyacid dehydrogenase NAD-binding domain-containing protein n=2 Tax=Halorussus TaxID=1070314 RepID=A0A8U0II17_9EURY|nr:MULTISPECIES: NAD(P)-dependent oxidoreductase [Halorussus]UPV73905.1 hypothetical protein M0R89_15345 [Halorussus limi]UPV99923.1 hypothetical protein M0R88_15565 [Halorussus gelatinilyticus]
MSSQIVVHPEFDRVWPFAADHLHSLWAEQGPVEFTRLDDTDSRDLCQVLPDPQTVTRLVSLGVPISNDCLDQLTALEEAVVYSPSSMYSTDEEIATQLEASGVTVYRQPSEGFWGQSVAEFAVGLTIAGLRRIPQLHKEIITNQEPWDYDPDETPEPGGRGHQFGDDPAFTNGTIAGKRVRIVGVGNIGSRYADFTSSMGATVAAYDPYADEPCFHRSDARKVWRLDELVTNADIFAPMVPLTEETEGLVTAEHINALPSGCLIVLVTRAQVCDMEAVRDRVSADEIALAADV